MICVMDHVERRANQRGERQQSNEDAGKATKPATSLGPTNVGLRL
jgi:hypothetical protein